MDFHQICRSQREIDQLGNINSEYFCERNSKVILLCHTASDLLLYPTLFDGDREHLIP